MPATFGATHLYIYSMFHVKLRDINKNNIIRDVLVARSLPSIPSPAGSLGVLSSCFSRKN